MSHKLAVTLVAACLFVPPLALAAGPGGGTGAVGGGATGGGAAAGGGGAAGGGAATGGGGGAGSAIGGGGLGLAGGRGERPHLEAQLAAGAERRVCYRRRSAWPRQRRSKQKGCARHCRSGGGWPQRRSGSEWQN